MFVTPDNREAVLWTGLFSGLAGAAGGYAIGGSSSKTDSKHENNNDRLLRQERTNNARLIEELKSKSADIEQLKRDQRIAEDLRDTASDSLKEFTNEYVKTVESFETLSESKNRQIVHLQEENAQYKRQAEVLKRYTYRIDELINKMNAQKTQYEAQIAQMTDAMQEQAIEIDRLTYDNEQLKQLWKQT